MARRVMSSTWSVSTSQSLAGLGRSSGQLGGSSAARLCSRRSPLVSPNIAPKHSKAQPPTTQRQHTRPIRKLSPTAPSIHLQARPTLSVFRESREIFFRNFFGRQRTLSRWTVVVALAALPPWSLVGGQDQVSLIKRRASAHSPAGCLIKNTDKFIYAPPRKTSRPSSIT